MGTDHSEEKEGKATRTEENTGALRVRRCGMRIIGVIAYNRWNEKITAPPLPQS